MSVGPLKCLSKASTTAFPSLNTEHHSQTSEVIRDDFMFTSCLGMNQLRYFIHIFVNSLFRPVHAILLSLPRMAVQPSLSV